jgi:hypothetical protein
MNCGCSKHIGCFAPAQIIDFGFLAPCTEEYIFEIWGANGTYTEIVLELDQDDPVTLSMTFNENATTTIKIRIPQSCVISGAYYFTTSDGACSWTVDGISPVC